MTESSGEIAQNEAFAFDLLLKVSFLLGERFQEICHPWLPVREKWLKVGDGPEGRHIKAVFRTPSILAEKGICHMTRDTITALPDPNGFISRSLDRPDPVRGTAID